MRVYLPRFFVATPEQNLRQFSADCAEAEAGGAALAVFPEQFLTGYRAELDAQAARQAFQTASSAHPTLTICCGTITAAGRNVQYWYAGGQQLAAYEKVHLFRPNDEHELWQAGKRYCAIDVGGLRTGLGTCNDVRFPEQMHQLSRHGKLQLLVYPALWPWQRDHIWAALLRARAIEHGAFCIGCCVAGVDNGLERFDGAGNYVFDPLGNQIMAAGRFYQLDLGALASVVVDTHAEYLPVTDPS